MRGVCGSASASALGRKPRLRCGALFHVANRTVSFHGVTADAVRFLLLLFEEWTFSSITQLPSVRTVRGIADSPVPNPPPLMSVPLPVATHESPMMDTSAPPIPTPQSGVLDGNVLRTMVRQLIDISHVNQRHLASLREEIVSLRSQLSSLLPKAPPVPPVPQPSLPIIVSRSDSADVQPPPTEPGRVCRRPGCDSHAPVECCVQFCQTHCVSPRCRVHGQWTRNQERRCRFRGCSSMVPRKCASGFCESHCTSFRCFCITTASPSLPQDASLFLRWNVSRVVAHAIALTASVFLQRTPELVGCQRITPSDVIQFDCRTFARNQGCSERVHLESSLPGNPVSDGPATPKNSFSVGTFNALRFFFFFF